MMSKISKLLLPWYDRNARKLPWRENADPYRVWISEIMLQQTRVEAVLPYYNRFLTALPNIKALSIVSDGQLFKLWEGLGYYSRAKNLKKAACDIESRFGGVFPNKYDDILSLPGIGPYTAGAISSICFNELRAAVDGNVLRIFTRLTEDKSPIDSAETKKKITAAVQDLYPKTRCGDFTQALMELGATVCTPKSPKCEICPVGALCLAKKHGTALNYPVKSEKKEKKTEQKTVFFLRCENTFALHRRPQGGLLGGLWELPNTEGILTAQQALQWTKNAGARPKELCKKVQKSHIFTHKIWEMTCYHILCAEKSDNFVWKTMEEIRKDYALPTAFRMFIDGE